MSDGEAIATVRSLGSTRNINDFANSNFKAREAIDKVMSDDKIKSEFLWSFGRKEKKMPRGFEDFVNSNLCVEFLDSIFDYCSFLFFIEDKKSELEAEAKDRNMVSPRLLQSETTRLERKTKRMADNYGKLIYLNRSIG